MVIIVILNQLGYLWLFVMHKTRQAGESVLKAQGPIFELVIKYFSHINVKTHTTQFVAFPLVVL